MADRCVLFHDRDIQLFDWPLVVSALNSPIPYGFPYGDHVLQAGVLRIPPAGLTC